MVTPNTKETMDIAELTQHPERLDRDTLYELRSLLALYPYYQTVRLLLLQNLYLLHDPTFDEELRRAAVYLSDRRVLFDLVEAAHYELRPQEPKAPQGWHVVKGSVINAISPGGWPTQRYMLRKDEEPARKANERDRLRNMDERRGKNGRETGPGCQQRGNSGGDHAAWNY